eukprot:CAMPEP_0168601030 /NCGR_PEP_ID=MMETSP0420-20121227/13180_1 /TAXON_ID=498008 /ORGANISM="Pessonella sp." /LENGTH=1006 /DNA_ID=CAMNT_0008639321 /DNA_START=1053 /DNA_END=4070 /DNA_ORIENTATION=+
MTILPMVLSILAMNKVSLDRTQAYLASEELKETDKSVFDMEPNTSGKYAVKISKASFEWTRAAPKKELKDVNKDDKNDEDASDDSAFDSAASNSSEYFTFELKKIDLKVKHGQLVMVCGGVGSGKSSLLSALLNEMNCIDGQVVIRGTIAYVPQSAWITNATVRENIIFSRPFDKVRYKRVLHAAGLKPDLKLLARGDETEIGERGINLSGGQKQRVSIARAMYGDQSLILLDDPLSAVDSHVAQHIFDEVIMGAVRERTRIMCTNQLQFLPHADLVVVMRDGKVVESGSYESLVESGLDFASLMEEFGIEANEEVEEEFPDKIAGSGATAGLRASKDSKKRGAATTTGGDGEAGKGQGDGKIIGKEEREIGIVGADIYFKMFKEGGRMWSCAVFSSIVLATLLKIVGDWWLSVWTSQTDDSMVDNSTSAPASFDNIVPPLETSTYLWTYTGIAGGETLFISLIGLFMVGFSLNVSRHLHAGMLRSLMKAPMAFFDATPVGRIVNRFSFDLDMVDFRLPFLFQQFFVMLFRSFAVLVVVALTSAYAIIGLIIVAILIYLLTRYYRKAAIEIQRVEAVSRSPIFAHFNETLQGLSSVRAYGQEKEFMQKNTNLVNTNTQALYTRFYTQSWLLIRLGALGALVAFIAMLIAIIYRDTLDPGLIGLSLMYSLSLIAQMASVSRQGVDLEMHMNGVERILEYHEPKLPSEAPASLPNDKTLGDDWPRSGRLEIKNLTMRYRPELDAVLLKSISLNIKDKEKVAIVGRTGSGKSSLLNALLRIVEIDDDGGAMIVDGVNIRDIGLHRVRRAMAIIPQDPILFTGSIRYNLDPLEECSDADLWRALELASLSSVVKTLEGGLDHPVAEGGENFSAGQRQLMCVARALARKPRILLMDEATASVDVESDAIIQAMVRDQFKDCTVITIAHRLNTVIDYDRVLVLADGEIAEYDHPGALLSKPTGLFTGLVEATGKSSSRRLKSLASQRYDELNQQKQAQKETKKKSEKKSEKK